MSCPFAANQPSLDMCAPAEPLGPPFVHYPNKNLSCKMVTGPGGMPFVRCDNFAPQFATGPGDAVHQPPNNHSSSFGDFYSNTATLPAMYVSPPSSPTAAPAPIELVTAHKDNFSWGWGWIIAFVVVGLITLALYSKIVSKMI